jgi:uracil-DNA glycosylase family 4
MRVAGAGPTPAEWFVCGKGPGQDEDRKGEPFVGKTGEEMRRFFDGDTLPPWVEVFRTNIYRQYGGKDYEYTDDDFARDEPELLDELERAHPEVIVAVGADAARYFLGDDVTLDEVHGLPWYLPAGRAAAVLVEKPAVRRGRKAADVGGAGARDVVVFPTYHPAAGFRSPEASALVSYDFAQLAMYAAGDLKPRKLYDDPIPNPQYFHVKTPAAIEAFAALEHHEALRGLRGVRA